MPLYLHPHTLNSPGTEPIAEKKQKQANAMQETALNISVDVANECWHKDELPWMPHLFSKSNVLALEKLANS